LGQSHPVNLQQKYNLKVSFMQFRKIGLCIAILASLSACGGGTSDAGNSSNTLVCTTPSTTQANPVDTALRLFITVYQLEAGVIDEQGAFILSSLIIFEFANDNSAAINGTKVPITSACYQAADKTLTLQLGQSDKLTLSEGGKATGTINGKLVRPKTP
jgi:hypothetical protein